MITSTRPTVVVTGADGAIGFETARQLTATGALVVLHAPTRQRALDAAARLITEGADQPQLHTVAADFAVLADVRAMARQLAEQLDRIDVLVNNAAIAGPEGRWTTGDGNERAFQVNYLAPYLLTRLLAERLDRMVGVSSRLHVSGNLDWADLQRTRHYAPLPAYAQSKLALTMFARALATKEPRVTSVSIHPGVTSSPIMHHYGRDGEPVADVAARVVRLCDPSAEIEAGAYYEADAPATTAPLATNPRAVDRLWKATGRLVGLDESRTAAA